MASPITNHNPASINSGKAMRPEGQEPQAGQRPAVAESGGSGVAQDEVTVSRAAQLLSQQPTERGQGGIQSADHAAQVAKGLRALFEGQSGQALAAQAAKLSPDMMELLKAG